MRMEIISGPDFLPVTLEEAKAHLRLDHSDEDGYVAGLIDAAAQSVAANAQLILAQRQMHLFLDRWPGVSVVRRWWSGVEEGPIEGHLLQTDPVALPVRPVQAVSAVAVFRGGGGDGWQEEAESSYRLEPGLTPKLVRANGQSWPQPTTSAGGIRLTLRAGFGPDWNAIPADLRHAVLMTAAHLYTNRGDVPATALARSGAERICATYRELKL